MNVSKPLKTMSATIDKQRRDKRYTFRMTADEAAVLDTTAKRLGVKPSEVARMAVFAVGIATGEQHAS